MKWFLSFSDQQLAVFLSKGLRYVDGTKDSGNIYGNFCSLGGKRWRHFQCKITFSGDAFNGSSDSSNYPAICNGSFTTSGDPDSVHFVNSCVFPANFDWTLILTGSYKLIQTGDSIYIRRIIGDFAYEEDVYSLLKQ